MSTSNASVGILVLGMHRSGTSALTRVLNLLGCALPGDLLGANPSNPAGHWESLQAIEINAWLLGALGSRWDDVGALPADWLARRETGFARKQVRAFVEREFSGKPLWVLKDPRLCRLAPLWLQVMDEMGIAPRIVVPTRHPADVACSLARRDDIPAWRSHLLWLRHLADAEAATRSRRRVLVRFAGLMDDARVQVQRIASALDLAWPNDPAACAGEIAAFLRPDLLHFDAASPRDVRAHIPLPSAVDRLHRHLQRADDAGEQAWLAIARASRRLADAASLYAPGIDAAEHGEATSAAPASVTPGDAGALGVLDAQGRAILERVEDSGALLHRVDRQLAAQRDVLEPALTLQLRQVVQWRAETQVLLERSAARDGAVAALAARLDAVAARLPPPAGQAAVRAAREADAQYEGRGHAASSANDGAPYDGGGDAKGAREAGDAAGAATRADPAAAGATAAAIATFDRAFYLQAYPDVAQSGLDPLQHFIDHGKGEGRLTSPPQITVRAGRVRFDPDKDTVLVVSHEASRTGAPVLGLNIAHHLGRKFNVVSLLLGGGALEDAFVEHSAQVVGPVSLSALPGMPGMLADQLLAAHRLKFAVVNSIESRWVLEALTRRFVPTVSLIHEFAAYTRPRNAFPDAILWAAETVFSTRVTRDDCVARFPELATSRFHILPQGRCGLLTKDGDAAGREEEDARVLRALRTAGAPDGEVVIIGAGAVQHRKGVDLFLDCAAQVLRSGRGERCRFVWIGKGYEPEHDLGYSVYLADQLQRAGLSGKVTFLGETPSIDVAYASADMLLVTSRLDPLPNVAIDAMAHGLPVACFDKTTGIADILADGGLADHCVSPYLDTADMAAKVLALAQSKALRNDVGRRLRDIATAQFDMARYVERLEAIADAAASRMAEEQKSAQEILASGLFRPDFFFRARPSHTPLDEVIRYAYVRTWATGLSRRKPCPGFHPEIYVAQHGTANPVIDPFTDYLRAGQPVGPWRYDVIGCGDAALPVPGDTRVALHAHVYYADLFPDLLARLSRNALRPDLFVSVPSAAVADAVAEALQAYPGRVADVLIVPNRGRDIGPLLTAFGPALLDDYDIVGHVHTKKSGDQADAQVGQSWHRFLLENLLGGQARMADTIVGRMAADPSIGIVFPDDPHLVGWGDNRPYAEALRRDLGLGELPDAFLFPVGTMFWARVDAIRSLFDLRLDWDDYPAEPLPYDGSMLHALERLFLLAAADTGARFAVTNVAEVSR